MIVLLGPLNPWHYWFFRRYIETVAECPHCRHGLTRADVEKGVCPSCKKPLKLKSESGKTQ